MEYFSRELKFKELEKYISRIFLKLKVGSGKPNTLLPHISYFKHVKTISSC